ncbi:S1C family serine protease [Kineococcus terrestris]|uniref:S1C family serine protease n=1 Tax=Kineococcus terrestris TaxID=2044856 RepID=UPI0034DB67B6
MSAPEGPDRDDRWPAGDPWRTGPEHGAERGPDAGPGGPDGPPPAHGSPWSQPVPAGRDYWEQQWQQQQWGGPDRRRRSRGAQQLAVATGVLALGLVGGLAGGALWDRLDTAAPAAVYPAVDIPQPSPGTTERPAGTTAAIAAAALPSVVALQVQTQQGSGTGSGFVLDASEGDAAFILTNNHVVAGAVPGGVTIAFEDGVQAPGEVVGADASYDLAVVRVEREGLRPLPLGDSSAVVVGDRVVAVGAPLGLQGTVTEGIVSALNRPVSAGDPTQAPSYIQAIQTDAAINPGNSGGPLLNSAGEVVGVNSAIAALPGQTSAGGSIGLGFSIPSEQARRTAEQLIRTGRAVHPVIGISLSNAYDGEGVQIATGPAPDGTPPVTPGGAGEQAGLQPGDVILAVQGRPVTTPEELIVDVRARQVGDTVTLTVRRGGSTDEVEVTLQADS